MSKNGTRTVVCERCRNTKLHHARGCCKCCYNKIMARGETHLYPTVFGSGVTRGAVEDFHPSNLDSARIPMREARLDRVGIR